MIVSRYLILPLLTLVYGLDFSASFPGGTVLHYETPQLVSERFEFAGNHTLAGMVILREFSLTGGINHQVFRIGVWQPPLAQCCRNQPIGQDLLIHSVAQNSTVQVEVDSVIHNLTISQVMDSGVLPYLEDYIYQTFDQVEIVCPLTCSSQLDYQMILDFSSSIDPTEFAIYKDFIIRAFDRFDISLEKVHAGVVGFSGRDLANQPDVIAFPTTSVNVSQLWNNALNDSSWVSQIDWTNHGPNAADYTQLVLTDGQSNHSGYATLESPVTHNSTLVRQVAANLVHVQATQGYSFTSLGTGLRLAYQNQLRQHYNRTEHPILIMLSDGENNRGEDPNALAAQLRGAGYSIFSVAVGNQVDYFQLANISANQTFFVDDFDQLDDILETLVNQVCRVVGIDDTPSTCQAVYPPVNNQPTSVSVQIEGGLIVPTLVGLNITFSDPDSFVVSLEVNWCGLIQAIPLVNGIFNYLAQHLFLLSLLCPVTITVTDNFGANVTVPIDLNLLPNQPPLVTLDASPTFSTGPADIDTTVAFSDPDGYVVSAVLDWGDLSHSVVPGVYTRWLSQTRNVTLTVTDNKGSITVIQRTITINQPPDLQVSVITPVLIAPQVVKFDITVSDPDGTVVDLTINGGSLIPVSQNTSLLFSTAGSYNVTVVATDNYGAETNQIVMIQVYPNALPTLTVTGPSEIIAPENVTLVVTSYDLDGWIVSIEIDWGDSVIDSNLTHLYTGVGVYNITITVTDNKGGQTSLIHPLTVWPNQLPVVSFTTEPNHKVVPQNVSLTVVASDPDGYLVDRWVDWGDSTINSEVSHWYNQTGFYNITVTVEDNKGGISSNRSQIVILENQLPSADLIVSPLEGLIPLTVVANGSESFDPDGPIEYYWRIDRSELSNRPVDGSVAEYLGQDVEEYTFQVPGEYHVGLRVEDNRGDSAVTEATIIGVNPAPPGNDPDPNDHYPCVEQDGKLLCGSLRVSGVCVNRFKQQAAFWVENRIDLNITVPVGPNNRLLRTPMRSGQDAAIAPGEFFEAQSKTWYTLEWDRQDLLWELRDPFTGLLAIGKVGHDAPACVGDNNTPFPDGANAGYDHTCAAASLMWMF